MLESELGPLDRARQTIGGVVQKAFPKKKISNRYQNYAVLLASFAIYFTVCTIFYVHYEHWEPSVALSFVVETMTTVGMYNVICLKQYHFLS